MIQSTALCASQGICSMAAVKWETFLEGVWAETLRAIKTQFCGKNKSINYSYNNIFGVFPAVLAGQTSLEILSSDIESKMA